ncbi:MULTISPECIES: hypothetical protein [unclassified Microcoleus]|uniref:hypothetical protein n=1 Tax=unclassified Microcoleus TaxID=2642155 RepID=UPI002FD2A915
MILRVDGYSYLLFELYQKLKAVETATDLSPCLKPGARRARSSVNCQLSTANCQLSTVKHQLLTANRQLTTDN